MSRGARQRPNRLVVLNGQSKGVAAKGVVWLVGAGPGDPELLTIKALRLLEGADVVVHDRLTPQPILDLARPGARLIDVGKRKSHHTLPQDDINALLVGLAREGLRVVRLKGGDPFLFGRGGEELEFCRAAGVEAHAVPGVTAALAAAAGAGAPLTHRGLAQAVTFVTGHAAKGAEPDLDWALLARPNHTVAVYMGLSTAGRIAQRLIAAGRAAGTPVAVVENASLPRERRLLTTLGELGDAVKGLEGPALLVVGEVAALADVTSISPFEAAVEPRKPTGAAL
ncbi:MAG TPA: uroporphyrinogen-III C-methyltransferase [Caulobacteraceae bacterium]|jgi:uroporphyrin-III C-methyltransferase|nr:uroporphyrinogen-III C-methyltransferase [Caulobacteraceae bacterium]